MKLARQAEPGSCHSLQKCSCTKPCHLQGIICIALVICQQTVQSICGAMPATASMSVRQASASTIDNVRNCCTSSMFIAELGLTPSGTAIAVIFMGSYRLHQHTQLFRSKIRLGNLQMMVQALGPEALIPLSLLSPEGGCAMLCGDPRFSPPSHRSLFCFNHTLVVFANIRTVDVSARGRPCLALMSYGSVHQYCT